MGQSDSRVVKSVETSLLEKIWNLLERKPENCDVAFCVGKEKKIVRTLKVILKASSPLLEKQFEKWEVAVIKDGDGIPLPDFDPVAFEIFVKLTSLDTWSLEILKTLNLPQNQILNLLSICQRFEMKKAVENLEILVSTFMQTFGEYKDTDDFLQLSQPNLKSILRRGDIGIKELDVFYAAIRWADFQCKEMNMLPTKHNMRKVLGDCLFEIRFPLMTCAEFTEAREAKNFLTAEENLAIYGFIGLEASKKLEFDAKKLPFKTTPRKKIIQEPKPNSSSKTYNSHAIKPPGMLTLSLARDLEIVENPPFVCDGSQKLNFFACEKNIRVYGLGFFGPIEKNGFYDAKVQILGACGIEYDSGVLEKRIFAEKGKTFYFVFDPPIDLKAGSVTQWNTFYSIKFYLKGANTSAIRKVLYTDLNLREGDTLFRLKPFSKQLAEILFKLS